MGNEEGFSLSNLSPSPRSRKPRKRLGIGEGSGSGKTCGKGQKGQKSRTGNNIPTGFEGGQMPLQRRLPKVGFTSRKRVRGVNVYSLVPLAKLAELGPEVGDVTLDFLVAQGLLRKSDSRVKITGGVQLSNKFSVEAHAFTKSAKAEIERVGGEARVVR